MGMMGRDRNDRPYRNAAQQADGADLALLGGSSAERWAAETTPFAQFITPQLMRILIIEDELDLANALARGLRQQGYAVDIAASGEEGWELGEINEYDLVVLDLNLPRLDGLEVCKRLRRSKPEMLILMLTARSRLEDKVVGLDLGADDYLVKPFHFDELTARIRALLRRDLRVREPILRAGDLSLDPASRTVWKGNRRLDLTTKEFAILHYLMRHPGEVISQEELIEHVWNEDVNLFTASVRVHIHSLRRKLGDNANCPRYIETLPGAGYRLIVPEKEQ